MPVPYWRLSAFYCCYFATLGAFLPFWSLYLKHIGFNAEQIGELTAMLIATKIFAPHLWGWLADRSGRGMRLIRITTLLSALTFVGFLYRHDYAWIAAVTIAFSLFWNSTLPQFEATTLLHLQHQPQHYSRVRLWGSLGFIAAVLAIGRFLDAFPIELLPVIMTALLVLNWLVALITPEAGQSSCKLADSNLASVLFKPEVLAFFSVYMLLQIAHTPYYVFYSVYLQQHLYSASQTGLLWALGVCAEIAIFLIMQPLLRSISLRGLLLGSLLLSSLRWLVIAYGAEHVALIISAQLLHAASFGTAHVVAIQLLQRYFGHGHQSKGQALYSSISFGLGGMMGSYYSGHLWDQLGGSVVFAMAAWICGLALLIAFIGVARSHAKPSQAG